MSNGHPLTFEFAEVKSFVLRSKLDGLSKEELDVESVDLNFPVRALQFANLYHLLQRLVVHVVCGPVHVVAHAFVQVVKVFL